MKVGDYLLTQDWRVGVVTKIEDPRIYFVAPGAPVSPAPVPEWAWLARTTRIPPATINALFGGPEVPHDPEPARAPVAPPPQTTPVRSWWTRLGLVFHCKDWQ